GATRTVTASAPKRARSSNFPTDSLYAQILRADDAVWGEAVYLGGDAPAPAAGRPDRDDRARGACGWRRERPGARGRERAGEGRAARRTAARDPAREQRGPVDPARPGSPAQSSLVTSDVLF